MYRICSFLKKREDISFDEFKDYYENRHIPLIRNLADGPLLYKRRYLRPEAQITSDEIGVPFDVMTELHFADREAFMSWMAVMSAAAEVAEDESRFLDRSRTIAYAAEECTTQL